MSKDCGRTIAPKIRTNWCDDESTKCSGSSRLDRPSGFLACTPPSITPSTFNAISSRARRSGSSEPRRPTNGATRSRQGDRAPGLGLVCSPQVKLTMPPTRSRADPIGSDRSMRFLRAAKIAVLCSATLPQRTGGLPEGFRCRVDRRDQDLGHPRDCSCRQAILPRCRTAALVR